MLSIALAIMLVSPAVADSYSDYGMQLYKQGNYKSAAMYFAQSLRANPANPTAVYYSALCIQKLGNAEAANNGFHTVIQVFPNSPEAALARQQLGLKPVSARPAVQTKATPAQATSHAAAAAHAKPQPGAKHSKK